MNAKNLEKALALKPLGELVQLLETLRGVAHRPESAGVRLLLAAIAASDRGQATGTSWPSN